MRVTFVIFSMAGGGAQRVMSIMANHWAAKQWKITLLTYGTPRAEVAYPLSPSVSHRALDIEGKSRGILRAVATNIRRLLILRQAVRASEPQVVISFLDRVNVRTILATIGLRIPVIVSERNNPARASINIWWRWLRRVTYPLATSLVAQTSNALELFGAQVRRKGRVIPNPVALIPKTDPVRPFRRRKTVVGLGRLVEQKGFDRLLRAFASAAGAHRDWILEIWGEGEIRAELEALRDELSLQGRASFRGWAADPTATFRDAGMFVLSSRYEGFPNVLCEAMACGVGVVSFDCPFGPGDIICDGVNGVLVAPDDVRGLAAAMSRLMSDDEARERLGRNAVEAVSRFGVDRVMEMWEDALQDALR